MKDYQNSNIKGSLFKILWGALVSENIKITDKTNRNDTQMIKTFLKLHKYGESPNSQQH